MLTQIDLLKKHSLSVRGHLGQHLLIDPNVQRKIVDLLSLQPKDKVLEIGPGLGALTGGLLERCGRLVAVEKDEKFVSILNEEYPAFSEKNYEVIQGDILDFDFAPVIKSKSKTPWKVVSNLPYYITAPILFKLLEYRQYFSKLVLMMQKEVADRLLAGPGTKAFGRLTLAVRYAADVQHAFDVSPNCFTPKPEVGSSVIVVTPHTKPQLSGAKEKFLMHLIQVAFSQRRKMLLRLLSEDKKIGKTRAEIQKIFDASGIPQTVRGEELMLKDYFTLTAALGPAKARG